MANIKTAAVLIIGDEILSGRTHDKNGNHIALQCTQIGINVAEMRVVPDKEQEIVESLNVLRAKYDYVFTTGGIGPTHDDITAECIAKAFDVGFGVNEEAYQALLNHYGEDDFNEARQKMAKMPDGVKLVSNPVSGAPGFNIDNVYVMAGVPKIMHAMLDYILPTLETGTITLSKTITTNLTEGDVAIALGKVQDDFPQVSIGSYPFFKKDNFGISLVIRSQDEQVLEKASEKLLDMLQDLGTDPLKTKIF